MTVFKPGNLVVLKSGGPVMTVDAVNTDIFDDNKVTGIVCVWFVGEKLQRVRFGQDAIEPARLQKNSSRKRKARLEEVAGEYKMVLDEMVAAMNTPADSEGEVSSKVAKRPKSANTVVEQPETAQAPKGVAAGWVASGIAATNGPERAEY
ncbi:uncharacterized protein YodC (DUF2158 family) [Bradyrhizobium sp. AZCC 1678]|uniref:DUF2158 domain-containing protein n=1 Tax=Bradyrhizobium sp. AZCC 1678 TaxID=3117030 RepID=UPI002FF38618